MKTGTAFSKRLLAISWAALLWCVSGCAAPGGPASVPRDTSRQSLAPDQVHPDFWPKPAVTSDFQSSARCEQCHGGIAEQQAQSSHATSWTDPVFFAQYTGELLPRAASSPKMFVEARRCAACHAPVAFMQHRDTIITKELVDPMTSGVTCDVCHTISGYEGDAPKNGNYVSTPGDEKLGPFQHNDAWHHVYNELQTRSEVCGVCHNAQNHQGLEVKSTYTEWRDSRFAAEGIQCQDCHMTTFGFLVGGAPVYESGRAASMTVGHAPERSKLYTHRFPGAHSRSQITGAITLSIALDGPVAARGGKLAARILVDNSRTGHKMPSGSADLRQLWLSVEMQVGNRLVPVAAIPQREAGGYDVAGQGKFDRQILGNDVPAGSRIYRSIYVDGEGKQTLRSYEAVKIVFDNRLNASEMREETYSLTLPADPKIDVVTLRASLKYLAYPDSFARGLRLPNAEPVEIASTSRQIRLQ